MTTSFLFTALDHQGKNVTEKVEAENLSQARYKLELRGYSAISFYESELSAEVLDTFDDRVKNGVKKIPKGLLQQNVKAQFNSSHWRHIFFLLKLTSVYWLIIVGCAVYTQAPFAFGLLGISVIAFIYNVLPVVFYNKMMSAYFNLENKKARFWGNIINWFNPISLYKIPQSELDTRLAGLDAREGNLPGALQKIAKYQNDPKVSRRMFNHKLVSIYGNAKQYDKMAECLENTLREGHVYQEETIDYALCLARRLKQTNLARQVLEKVYDLEITVMVRPFLPFCKGIIELEEGNISEAEFYLKMANDEMKAFEKNEYLVGVRSEIKAFLSIVLAKTGQPEEAAKLFREAKKYLRAAQDTELLARCEEALN